jgi:hypothetical protein
MSTLSAPERQFVTFSRGAQRDLMLTSFRIGLRQLISPDTNEPFTEDEIATATGRLSKWYIEADAIDLVLQAGEQRARYLADQVRIDRAGTAFLEGFHLPMWGEQKLPATGGSGYCTAVAPVGVTFIGSTTVPDAAAHYATDDAGLRYQVLFSVTTPANGIAGSDPLSPLIFVAIDTGTETNLVVGKKLRWANPPLGAVEQSVVTVAFTGGTVAETDAAVARRLLARIRHKPAAGNNSHFRSWARDSSNSVEDAAIFACAHHAGSVHVAIIQKRANVLGPTGRIASLATISAATLYLTPPASPVVPTPPHVVLTGCTAEPSNAVLSLALPVGRTSGWEDLTPWPGESSGAGAVISAVTTQTYFEVTTTLPLPTGVTAPSLMVWNALTSRFEKLLVTSVITGGGNLWEVELSAPPTKTLAVGDLISPYTRRHTIIAETIEAYFDSLGPGEVIDLSTDLRAHRAFRWPEPHEELPQRAGAGVLALLQDALGSSLATSTLESMSVGTPSLPTEPVDGPSLIVAGKVGIYAL